MVCLLTRPQFATLSRDVEPLCQRRRLSTVVDTAACHTTELLAIVIEGAHALETRLGLLARFGSLHNVAHASDCELTQVTGVGSSTAARLKAALEISRRLPAPEAGCAKSKLRPIPLRPYNRC